MSFPQLLVSNTCMLLSALVSELAASATGTEVCTCMVYVYTVVGNMEGLILRHKRAEYLLTPTPIPIIHPCPAELFVFIFYSSESLIADAFSSFNSKKFCLFMKNRHHKLNYLILSFSMAFNLVFCCTCVHCQQLNG